MQNWSMVIGRILLAHIFLLAGISKISGFADTQAYMESVGVPGMLLIPVILLEIGGGLAVILGWQTRIAALALAAFSVIAACIFHNNFADQMQSIMFMKNLSIAGGLMVLAAMGAGRLSLDSKLHGR